MKARSAAQHTYEEFLRQFSDRLKTAGFRRRGNTTARDTNGIWHLLTFQRSQKSSKDDILFTLNVGIASERLLRLFDVHSKGNPDVTVASIRLRIQDLLPPADRNRDWWSVDTSSECEWLATEFGAYADELLLPFFETAGASDIALRDYLLSGAPSGLTRLERLMHASALQRMTADKDLDKTLDELERIAEDDPVVRPTVEIHRTMLGDAAL
jgi:Domain of unknown function (DUF4304)